MYIRGQPIGVIRGNLYLFLRKLRNDVSLVIDRDQQYSSGTNGTPVYLSPPVFMYSIGCVAFIEVLYTT